MQKEFDCLRLDGESREEAACQVAEEVPLSIFINGRHFVTAMISPEMKGEFVIGHLFSERIVGGAEEIESLEIEGNVARAIVANPVKAILPHRPIVSGCGGIASFLDQSRLPEIRSSLRITRAKVLASVKAISSSGIHQATGGVHSVGLFDEKGEVCIIEDIGRHNALDKALGVCLNRGLDFACIFAASTGRISSDMALKCAVAGIPIIASRGAATSLAITLALRTGLSIVGFVRGKRMNVYTNGQRIEGC